MGRGKGWRWLVFGVVAVILTACGKELPDYPARTPPAGVLENPAALVAGAALFKGHCAPCHGRVEEGRSPRADFFQPPAPDFREAIYRTLPPDYLFWRIATGKTVEPFATRGSVMPSWGATLSDAEIWQLVASLRSRSGR